ncbi:MAG: hypothetical protein ABI670_15650 [Chloroflexota bacterium]
MANSVIDQANGSGASTKVRLWVFGVLATASLMLVAGTLLAATIDGTPRPWTGLTFVIAMGLALVVGLSKTSSA